MMPEIVKRIFFLNVEGGRSNTVISVDKQEYVRVSEHKPHEQSVAAQ
jgi:hypothetical protein